MRKNVQIQSIVFRTLSDLSFYSFYAFTLFIIQLSTWRVSQISKKKFLKSPLFRDKSTPFFNHHHQRISLKHVSLYSFLILFPPPLISIHPRASNLKPCLHLLTKNFPSPSIQTNSILPLFDTLFKLCKKFYWIFATTAVHSPILDTRRLHHHLPMRSEEPNTTRQ